MTNENTLRTESNQNLGFLTWKKIWHPTKVFLSQLISVSAKFPDLDLERFEKLEAKKTIHNFLRT